MPRHNRKLAAIESGQRGNVWVATNAPANDRLERDALITCCLELLAAHAAEHSKHIQYRLIKPIARQRTKAGKVRLTFEFEGPGQSAFKVHTLLLGEFIYPGEARGCITGEHGPVAVSQ